VSDGGYGNETKYDDGSSSGIVYRSDKTSVSYRDDGQGIVTREVFDAGGNKVAESVYTAAPDGNGGTEEISANGVIRTIRTDTQGKVISDATRDDAMTTVMKGLQTTSDALALLNAIKNGQPLPILGSGLKFVQHLDPGNTVLTEAGVVGSGILNILSLDNALKNGDVSASITAGANLIDYSAKSYAYFNKFKGDNAVAKAFPDAGPALTELGEALPYINMVNSLAHGDYTSFAVGLITVVAEVPILGEVYAVFQLAKSLLGGGPPDPWGTGRYVWNGTGIVLSAAGEGGGQEAVSGFMNNLLDTMNTLITQAKQENPASALGLIPNRMPSISYGTDGWHLVDIDPLSGLEKHPGLRYDSTGKPYNAAPGSPESFQSLGEAFMLSALSREAIAPEWEVKTAALQTAMGDPLAGLGEEERAGRAGQLALPESGATTTWRPVVLDLNGDGIHTVDKANAGVLFDVDDSGFQKNTAWIGNDDAFLTLDRNYNGHTDSGRELFSNGKVALDARGLAGLAWADSNGDGKLDAADPVFKELKVWRDANSSGAVDAGEETSLAQNGITSLDFEMGAFQQNGVTRQMASPDLLADTAGSRVNVIPEGILIQSNDGTTSLLVTRVVDQSKTGGTTGGTTTTSGGTTTGGTSDGGTTTSGGTTTGGTSGGDTTGDTTGSGSGGTGGDPTKVQANPDGITGIENVELIVNSRDLLANDHYGALGSDDLALKSVFNVRHGTAFVDDNHFVHFQPETNYSGPDAGFDYGVIAPNGEQGTATVAVTLESQNQAPTITTVTHDSRTIYGYYPLQMDEFNQVTGGGEAIYAPYDQWVGQDDYMDNIYVHHDTPLGTDDSGAGQVVAADVDDPASSLTYQVLNQPQYGAATIDSTGHFQYTGWSEPGVVYGTDTLNGPSQQDAFQVKVSDPHGASVTQTIEVTHYGPYTPPRPSGGGGGCLPVAVDLAGNGFSFTPVDQSNIFMEVNSDGWKHQISWIKPGEGLLAYDPEGRGTVTDASQISFARYVPGAQSDLAGLAAFDSNHNGSLDVQDEAWKKFGIWQDSNSNGITDPGEFQSLDQLGVVAINLTSDKQFAAVDGNVINGIAAIHMADGGTLDAADLTLAYSNKVQVPNPDGSTDVVTPVPASAATEQIEGTDGNDLLLGKTGNVVIKSHNGNDVIFSGDGNDRIEVGNGNTVIYAGNGADLITTGTGDNAIYTGRGNDVILAGGGNNAIFAGGGNDVILAGDGNNLVYARSGNNLIRAGDGDNSIVVGSGNNVVFVGNGNNTVQGGSGRVRIQVGSGNNTLIAGTGIATMVGGSGDNTFVINKATDEIVAQASAHNTVRASFSYVMPDYVQTLELSGTDGLVGTGNDLDNTITGNAGNSTLISGNGNDTLIAGSGVTTMIGGAGNDTFVVKHAADVVQAQAGGRHTIQTFASYTASANVQNLTAVGKLSITLTGNDLDNVITANDGGDVLIAGTGVATMVGGKGNDTFVVNKAADVVTESADQGIDTVMSSVSYSLSDNVETLILTDAAAQGTGNTLDNVILGNDVGNVLIGGDGNDTLYGGAADDELDGGTGNDALDGGTGNDALDGGIGADLMRGGSGDDNYVVDDTGDRVLEAASEGIDTVFSSISYVLPDQVENLTLSGTSDLNGTGNALDNVLVGNSGNNLLDGGLGNDTYVYKLGAGLDTLIDAGGNDTVRFGAGLSLDNVALRLTTDNGVLTAHVRILGADGCEQPDQGFDFVMDHDSTGKAGSPIEGFQFADGSTKTFADVQIKTVLSDGVHDITTITTGRDDDIITAGNNQHNTIDSGSGNDTVYAFNQGDTIFGGGGNDVLVGGNGDDTIDGGCGTDILAGGHGDDVLRDLGDDGGNVLLGSYGNDTIVAGSNDDFIAGGLGGDTISAGGGANVIAYNKNDGADTITPSAGAQNTLSLGGGISDSDLALRKAGNDLVLEMDAKNDITFKDWYLSPGNRNFVNLQMIEDASNDYKPDSATPLFNKRVVNFDFLKLVGEFDQALATTPALTSWSLMNGMLDAYLSGSDTEAIGGDLAYQYGTKNGAADVGIDSGMETLKQHGFGSHAHAFNRAGVGFPGELRVA
jgi:VCBS repeat-containing protein